MGRVYKAKDNELNTTVALKVIRPKFSSDKLFIKRLKEETLIARAISHENVIRIHDIGEITDIKFISMDYIGGENLKEFIRASGKLTVETAIKIGKHICEALKAAHKKGIVHRDLKPQNIMVDKNGIAYTMDFGLARAVKSRDKMIPGSIYGTPQYTSPEQAKGEEADERSDIYSLGTIMYEMLTGKPQVEGKTKEECLKSHIEDTPIPPSKINPRIPQSLENIILECLEKDRDERYQNIDKVLKDLNAYERDLEPFPVLKRKRRWIVATAASVVVILIGIFILFKLGLFEPAPQPAKEGRISLAVLYFENNTGEESLDHLQRTVSSLISYDLLQSKYIRAITSDRLLDIYKKLALMNTSRYSRNDLKKIASESGADHILLGNIYKIEETYRINTMLHEVSTWTLMGTPSSEGSNISSIVDSLGKKIKLALNLSDRAIAADIDNDIGQITTESTEALNYYFEGIKLYKEGKYTESNEILEKAIQLDPEFAMAYSQMALNHSYEGKNDLGRQKLEIALSFLDRISLREKYLIRGYKAAWIDHSPHKAIQIYQELLQLYPDDVNGLVSLGSIYRNQEEWDLSLRQFEKVLEIDSKNVSANENLYVMYMGKGLYNKAVEVLNRNKDLFPQRSQTQTALSMLYAIQHKTELAHQHADAALSLDPESTDSILNKGYIYVLSGDLKKAENHFLRLSDKEDNMRRLQSLYELACLHILRGEFQKSKTAMLQALQQFPVLEFDFFETQFLLLDATLNLKMNQFAEALVSSKLATEKSLKINLIWNTQLSLLYEGLAHLEIQNLEEAEITSQKLKEFIDQKGSKSDRRLYFLLRGKINLQKGLVSQAIDLLEMACALLPAQMIYPTEHALFLDAIASAEEMSGSIDSAQKHYSEITDLTTGRMMWGDIYAKSFYKLANIFEQKGQTDKAIEHYEKFLDLWKDADKGLPELADAKEQLALLKK